WRLSDQLAAGSGGRRTIEADRLQCREVVEQMLDAVVRGLADRLIEASAPRCRGDHVPQADAAFGQPLQPLLVGTRLQLLPDRTAEQPPELIGRMGIITVRGERGVAGQ